jgi:hypothetical protein
MTHKATIIRPETGPEEPHSRPFNIRGWKAHKAQEAHKQNIKVCKKFLLERYLSLSLCRTGGAG